MSWKREDLADTNFGVPAITFNTGTYFVFTREANSKIELTMSPDGQNWEKVPDIKPWNIKSGLSCVSRGENKLDVIAIDYNSTVVHLSFNGSQWSDWAAAGTGVYFFGTPALSKMNENRMDAFAIGSTSLIYHNVWTNGAWTEWKPIVDVSTTTTAFGATAVTAASSSPTTCDVFALDHESKIRSRRLTVGATGTATWSDWKVVNGNTFNVIFNITATSCNPNTIDLFTIGADLNVYQGKINVFGVSTWTKIANGPFTYGVDAISHAPGKITLLCGSTNSNLVKFNN